jgi:hypothetical protein
MKKQFRRFIELSGARRMLLLRALLVVVAVRAALWTCPTRVVRRIAAIAATGRRRYTIEEFVWSISAVGRYLPRVTCLTQALALHALLARSGHKARVEIGVCKDSGFEAHAWVQCEDRIIMGARETGRFSPILRWE